MQRARSRLPGHLMEQSLSGRQALSLFHFSRLKARWAQRQACLCSRKAFALYEVLLGLLIFAVGIIALGRAVNNCMNASVLSADDGNERRRRDRANRNYSSDLNRELDARRSQPVESDRILCLPALKIKNDARVLLRGALRHGLCSPGIYVRVLSPCLRSCWR